jgi:hypothetical protein
MSKNLLDRIREYKGKDKVIYIDSLDRRRDAYLVAEGNDDRGLVLLPKESDSEFSCDCLIVAKRKGKARSKTWGKKWAGIGEDIVFINLPDKH